MSNVQVVQRVLNLVPSRSVQRDWCFADALSSGSLAIGAHRPCGVSAKGESSAMAAFTLGHDDELSFVRTVQSKLPSSVDLRSDDWPIHDQGSTGSCVGWAVADGVLRYQLTQAGKISVDQALSVRFLWMASKETDEWTARPATFLESAGTSLKAALDVARKYGCALDYELPFELSGPLYQGSEATFYASIARRKLQAILI